MADVRYHIEQAIAAHEAGKKNLTADHLSAASLAAASLSTLEAQLAAARGALEAIAGRRQWIDDLASNRDIANQTLEALASIPAGNVVVVPVPLLERCIGNLGIAIADMSERPSFHKGAEQCLKDREELRAMLHAAIGDGGGK